MIDKVLQLLIAALRRWTARLLALTTSRLRVLLISGISVVGALSLGLLYHALSGNDQRSAQTMRLLAAYDKNWLIALAFFSAAAAGYTYWALQVVAEDSPDNLRRRLEFFSEIAFLGAVGWVIIALLLWNFGLLFEVPSVS
jgi:hypothetical protein